MVSLSVYTETITYDYNYSHAFIRYMFLFPINFLQRTWTDIHETLPQDVASSAIKAEQTKFM